MTALRDDARRPGAVHLPVIVHLGMTATPSFGFPPQRPG